MVVQISNHKHFILEVLYLSSSSKANIQSKQSRDKKTYPVKVQPNHITKRQLINRHNLKLRYPKRNTSTECIIELSHQN